jgi:hypothetical protein
MKVKKLTYFLLGTVVAFTACRKDKPASLYFGYDYFPNNIGHWVEYNVDSISFRLLPIGSDTFNYQVKDVIDSFYTDNTGARTQVIQRFKKATASSGWVYQKTYTANLTATEATRTEDGVKYVKLVFPVTLNSVWNGGAFSTIPSTYFQWNDTSFQYTVVNTPSTINGTKFDSTLTVLQDEENTLQYHRFYEEQYAVNVGRIYKEIIEIDSPYLVFSDPNVGLDSLLVPSDYIPLLNDIPARLSQGSTLYTETYVASGN